MIAVGIGKACSKCGERKPLDAFHADPRQQDGRRAICKACRCAQEGARRARNVDIIRQQQREYYQRNRGELCAYQSRYRRANRAKLRAYFREYRKRRPDVFRKSLLKWQKQNPEKRRAHSLFWAALRRGEIEKLDACQDCGAGGYVEAHHDDYSKPLEVRWLCETCHAKADEQRRSQVA